MATTRFYDVNITRGDDPDGLSGIELTVHEEMLILLTDMALEKGHVVEITKCEDMEAD